MPPSKRKVANKANVMEPVSYEFDQQALEQLLVASVLDLFPIPGTADPLLGLGFREIVFKTLLWSTSFEQLAVQ